METICIYTLNKSVDNADFFFDVEVLWKSFIFSYHNLSGQCRRIDTLTFEDPNGIRYRVNVAFVRREVTHL